MAGTHVAEIAARYAERHLLGIRLGCLDVAGKVVHHLRQQTRPVDGVDRTNLVFALELEVVGHCFDDVLAIIKHALDGDVVDVGVLQAEHLCLLEGAHAAVWAGHEDAHALFATHGVLCGAAGVATGGAQNVELFAAAGQFVFEQVAQQLHGHVLERQSRAIGERFDPDAVLQVAQGHDFAGAEYFGGVGLGAQGTQVVGGNVVDVQRQDFKRQRGVALLVIDLAPAGQRGVVHLRIGHRHVQAAVRRQAFEQDFAEAFAVLVAACRDVLHSAVS